MARRLSGLTVLVLLAGAVGPASAIPPGAPRGVHVSFGADPRTQATVTWFTDGSVDPGGTVQYGGDDTLGTAVTAVTQPAPGVGALVHEAVVSGLPPGGRVHYRVIGSSGSSPIRTFATAPSSPRPYSFTVFSDHGTEPESMATARAVEDADPDFHLMAGDLAYAQPGDFSFPDDTRWDTWFSQNEGLFSTVPLMVGPGNHEKETVGGLASYRARFALPGQEVYYSFDYLNTHVLVLQSDRADASEVQPQMALFAEQDLLDAKARKDAGTIDFIIVMQHHPIYSNMRAAIESTYTERNTNPYLMVTEERLLHQYDVDILLTGHNHLYERTVPMRFGQGTTTERSTYTDPDGFIEVISGGGGEGLYRFKQKDDIASWSIGRAECFHYVRFDVDGRTLTARAIATGGQPELCPPGAVLDTWTATRG